MNAPIDFVGDKSNGWRGLHFERDGQIVSLDLALREGFRILPNDAPMALTLLAQFFQTRDESHN